MTRNIFYHYKKKIRHLRQEICLSYLKMQKIKIVLEYSEIEFKIENIVSNCVVTNILDEKNPSPISETDNILS